MSDIVARRVLSNPDMSRIEGFGKNVQAIFFKNFSNNNKPKFLAGSSDQVREGQL